MSIPDVTRPDITRNATNAPYWSALSQGRLDFQHCRACGHQWLPARENCPNCLAADPEWQPASGRGKLVSWVVYHKAYAAHLEDRVPYNVAIVELAEGPRMISNIIGHPEGQGLYAGADVELSIAKDFGLDLPCFRLQAD